jgi:hypothetical protein
MATSSDARADDKRYWDVIAFACDHGIDDFGEWDGPLIEALTTLPPEDVVRFDHWLDERADALHTRRHWAAADLINGGCDDREFADWRYWVVGMGKGVYEAALADPDSLAEVVDPDREAHQAEIYAAAFRSWQRMGRPEEGYWDAYEALGEREPLELTDDEWDVDEREAHRRLPRLSALYPWSYGHDDWPQGADDFD